MINKKIHISNIKKGIGYHLSLSREEMKSLFNIDIPKNNDILKPSKLKNFKTLNKKDSIKLMKNQDKWIEEYIYNTQFKNK